jgi:hypothetical protein
MTTLFLADHLQALILELLVGETGAARKLLLLHHHLLQLHDVLRDVAVELQTASRTVEFLVVVVELDRAGRTMSRKSSSVLLTESRNLSSRA